MRALYHFNGNCNNVSDFIKDAYTFHLHPLYLAVLDMHIRISQPQKFPSTTRTEIFSPTMLKSLPRAEFDLLYYDDLLPEDFEEDKEAQYIL